MIKRSLLLILPAEDFNEDEYLTVKRILEISGFKLFVASDANSLCIGKKGLKVKADVSFFNMNENNFTGIIFIGGSGVKKYWDKKNLHIIANKFFDKKKLVAAICSAPVILAKAGLIEGKDATCYPEDRRELEKCGVNYKYESVVIQKNIITAQDSASSLDFANAIVNFKLK